MHTALTLATDQLMSGWCLSVGEIGHCKNLIVSVLVGST